MRSMSKNNQLGRSSWKYLSLIGDEQVISLLHKNVYVFSDSGKMNENPQSNMAWENRLTRFKSSQEYKALDKNDGEPMEFEWNIFPGFTTLQHCNKVQELMSKNERKARRIYRTDHRHVGDISWGSQDNEQDGHFWDLDQRKSGTL